MRFLERMLTRRHDQRLFSSLKPHVRQRLTLAARELCEAEDVIAAALGLSEPPRLLMIDEEEAVVLRWADRDELFRNDDAPSSGSPIVER